METTSLNELHGTVRLLLGGVDQNMAWRIAAANLLALIGGLLAGLAPVALKHMIDAASAFSSASAPYGSIAGFGVAYLACLAFARLSTELRPWLIGAVEQRLYAGLRLRYFRHLLDLPLSFHLERRTGALAQTLQQAISGYQSLLFSLVNGFVPVMVEGLTVMLVLFALGLPALTFIFAMTALVLSMIIRRSMARLQAAARAVSQATVDSHAKLADSLINCESIKCFGAEQHAVSDFVQLSHALESRWRHLQHCRLGIGLAITATFCLSLAASIAISVHAMSQGTLSVGGFVLANLYMVQIIRPLEMLSNAARDMAQGLAFVRPLMAVLKTPTEPRETGPIAVANLDRPTDPPSGVSRQQAPAISFSDIHLAFDGGTPVLDGLNLDIPAGTSLAIVGPSGSGKSSLARLLLRLCEPDAGRIMLDGSSIEALPIEALRSRIAVVPQDLALFNSTIAANIGLGRPNATPQEIERAADLAGLHGFIKALPDGYQTPVGERGLKLSGGERQRIAIARAVLRAPSVFIFDEATSLLDSLTERAIVRNLRRISTGCTTIMIAHRLSAIQHVDEIAVLSHGKIAERGRHAALLARGSIYASLWHAQQAGRA